MNQTIHTSSVGDVLNPTTATGFRCGDVELRSDTKTIRVGNNSISFEYLRELIRRETARLSEGGSPYQPAVTP